MELHNQANQFLLTEREKEVLTLLAKGYSASLIAKELNISETTVVSHREHIKEKIGAKNTPELINLAWEKGILGSI
jgi:two-component system, NarL family, response regulator NreC